MQGLVPRPGELPYKSDGDARRFALGCKLQILVSLGMETYYILPIQVSLSTVHNEISKKCPATDHREITLRGHFKLKPHPHWSPLGV